MPITQNGYVIHVVRTGTQTRAKVSYRRTVGTYETYFNQQLTGLSGFIVERQGPGDNTITGKTAHCRIAAGKYPLFTHISPVVKGAIKYRTIGYQANPPPSTPPRPCLEVGGTGARDGILIHPASGFLMSIGCFNPSGPLPTGDANVTWADSKARVVALIDDVRQHIGAGFPAVNNAAIPNAWLIVEGQP